RESFARAIGVPHVCASPEELLALPELTTVYVASNHATHAAYAAAALSRNLSVYVEKPIAVSEAQLVSLLRAARNSRGRIFAGYNRPFSAAIRTLRQSVQVDVSEGVSLQCFVSGHRIDAAHWY